MLAVDDHLYHDVRVGVSAAAGRVVADRPEADHPLTGDAVVDDGAVVQVAVELEALVAISWNRARPFTPLHRIPGRLPRRPRQVGATAPE